MRYFKVLQPIEYKNPDSSLYHTVINPEDGYAITLPHLSEAEIDLLERMRYIKEITSDQAAELKKVPRKKKDEDEKQPAAKTAAKGEGVTNA